MSRFVWFLAGYALVASAQPEDKIQAVLAGVDAILGPVKGKRMDLTASRSTAINATLCEHDKGDGTKAFRDFLCEPSTLVSRWGLWNLPVSTGGKGSALLEVRRFSSPEAARAAKTTGVERYGGPEVLELERGTIGAYNIYVYWVDDLLFSVQYPFGSTSYRTKSIGAVLDLLRKTATPFEGTEAIGLLGDWSLIASGAEKRVELPDQARFRHFFKVTGVTSDDVLWLRTKPTREGPGEKLGKIPPDASCLPLVFVPPVVPDNDAFRDLQGWVMVKFDGKGGWAKRRFLAEQPAEECLPHP